MHLTFGYKTLSYDKESVTSGQGTLLTTSLDCLPIKSLLQKLFLRSILRMSHAKMKYWSSPLDVTVVYSLLFYE